MTPLEAEIARKVRQWLGFAGEDLSLAQHGLTLSTGVPFRLIAYHAQQSAEKCIKGYLVSHKIDFPFTHNIGHLLELCRTETPWRPDLDDAADLTPFAITARYPGLFDEVTEAEALLAIETAKSVRDAIYEQFAKEGISLE